MVLIIVMAYCIGSVPFAFLLARGDDVRRIGSGNVGAANGVPAAAGFAAIVGHIYPVWLRFQGGKGVATACGVFTMLTPLAALPAFAVFMAAAWTTRYVSLGSVLATIVLPPVAYAAGYPAAMLTAACAASLLILFRHRGNLARLRAGTERRLGARA
jgi:glycerol-3-phosphate acyltransferase PlsY